MHVLRSRSSSPSIRASRSRPRTSAYTPSSTFASSWIMSSYTRRHRNAVLEPGVAVEHHRRLHLEPTALGGDHHALFERRLLQPLTLLAARLQVLLQPGDAVRASAAGRAGAHRPGWSMMHDLVGAPLRVRRRAASRCRRPAARSSRRSRPGRPGPWCRASAPRLRGRW